MKKEAIWFRGKLKEVREDTARAWRAQNWSLAIFLEWIIAALLIFAIFVAILSYLH